MEQCDHGYTIFSINLTWWCQQMKTFSALLVLSAGNSPVTAKFPHKGQWREALMLSLVCTWIKKYVLIPLHGNHNEINVFQGPLTRCENLRVAHAPGIPGTFSPPPRFSDPDMHYGTCVTHVSWCMPGSLSSGFIWGRWRGKRSRHSRRMR